MHEGWTTSNGTQAAGFRENNCDMCLHDHHTHMGTDGQGCPIILWNMRTRLPVPMWMPDARGVIRCDVLQEDGCS